MPFFLVSIPSLKTLEMISQALHTSLKDLLDFEYSSKDRGAGIEKEISKILAFLQTKRAEDIRMSYRLLKTVFEEIEKNYITRCS